MKRKKGMNRPVMTLKETEDYYQATVNDKTVTVRKDEVIMISKDTRQHPRLHAIYQVAELAGIEDWILMNV